MNLVVMLGDQEELIGIAVISDKVYGFLGE